MPATPNRARTASLIVQNAVAPAASAVSGRWCGRLTGIASEWSPQFPGYLAGAVEAARLGVSRYLSQETSP